MGLLQLHLRPGKQRINLNSNIPKGNIIVRHMHAAFNVENHGFYLLTLDAPFLYTNNVQNNTTSKKGLLLPIQHDKSSTFQNFDYRLGQVEIPRNFEINVDLDNGHQIFYTPDVQASGPYFFNPYPGTPAKGNYVINGPATSWVSVGVNADKILNFSDVSPTPGNNVIEHTNGVINGPRPFMYSMVLTLEYDDGLIEERLQQLLS